MAARNESRPDGISVDPYSRIAITPKLCERADGSAEEIMDDTDDLIGFEF